MKRLLQLRKERTEDVWRGRRPDAVCYKELLDARVYGNDRKEHVLAQRQRQLLLAVPRRRNANGARVGRL